jgi:hypothetical protein
MTIAMTLYAGEYREQPFNILLGGAAWTGMAAVFTGSAKLVMTWKATNGNNDVALLKECTPAPTGTDGVWKVTDINQAETMIWFKLADTQHLDAGDYVMDAWFVRDDGEWVPLFSSIQTVRIKQGVTWPE